MGAMSRSAGASRSSRGAPSGANERNHSIRSRATITLASARGRYGPNVRATSPAAQSPPGGQPAVLCRRAPSPGSGRPRTRRLVRSINRLRVAPCENSSGAISIFLPRLRGDALSSPTRRETRSPHTRSSTWSSGPSCRARTAASVSSSTAAPFKVGIATLIVVMLSARRKR